MAELIFYTNPQSRGRIVRWMLEEVGQPYETEVVPYDQMKSERYLAIHPLGKVPAIKHNGHVLTECAAICAYLADVFPEARLGPNADEKADYYRWLFYAAGPVEQACHGGVVHGEHGNLLATRFFLREVADPHLPGSLSHLASMFAQQVAGLCQSKYDKPGGMATLLLLVLIHVLDIGLV